MRARIHEAIERGVKYLVRIPNLSTAQFAALGLWATSRHGVTVPSRVWRKHLESLVTHQTKTGSWPYGPRAPIGYPTGTMMGAANFALAEKALGDDLRKDPVFYRKVLAARLRGCACWMPCVAMGRMRVCSSDWSAWARCSGIARARWTCLLPSTRTGAGAIPPWIPARTRRRAGPWPRPSRALRLAQL